MQRSQNQTTTCVLELKTTISGRYLVSLMYMHYSDLELRTRILIRLILQKIFGKFRRQNSSIALAYLLTGAVYLSSGYKIPQQHQRKYLTAESIQGRSAYVHTTYLTRGLYFCCIPEACHVGYIQSLVLIESTNNIIMFPPWKPHPDCPRTTISPEPWYSQEHPFGTSSRQCAHTAHNLPKCQLLPYSDIVYHNRCLKQCPHP